MLTYFAEGTRTELVIGSIPTLKLPKKTRTTTACKRPPPKERYNYEKYVAQNLDDIRKQIKKGVKKLWKAIDNSDSIVFTFECLSYDQIKYQVVVSADMKIGLVFYGWAVPSFYDPQLNPLKCTMNQMLSYVENFDVCLGCNVEGAGGSSIDSLSLVAHVVTKSAKPFTGSEFAAPCVITLASR